MSRLTSLSMSLVVIFLACILSFAQAPTGTVTGTVTDPSGAVVPNASVTIINKATGVPRTVTTNTDGLYSASSLQAGDYQVKAEAPNFKTTERDASVLVGQNTQVNLAMSLGASNEVVNVEAAGAQINYENHEVTGVIEQAIVQDLPLNGRSYMQLASLEPGVTITTGSTAQFNALFTVSVLGSGNRTLYTIDGGSVSDNIDTASGISAMNFSQELVQEFQISTVNFDISTGVAAGGAINVVTRSGTNDLHGSAYFFYRDHNMAAYPLLNRNPFDEDPFFARKQPGAAIGGPIKKDKTFFFFSYEHTFQVQALNSQGTLPSVAPLSEGTYGSPYNANLYSIRFDHRINTNNNLFLRYSHDGNAGFGPSLTTNSDPSNWAHNINWADQSIIGLTSTVTANIVNDVRFEYNYWSNKNLPAVASDCGAPCAAAVLPTINQIVGAGTISAGPNGNSPQARNTRRYEPTETLTWQKGNHRLKFGGDMDRAVSSGLWGFCTICTLAVAPEYITGLFESAYGAPTFNALFPNLPKVVTNDSQLLNLPVLNLSASIFEGVGVGADSTPAPYNRSANKPETQYRVYVADTWKIKPNLTVNYGLAWNGQTGWYGVGYNYPQDLAPIFGSQLNPTSDNLKEFQPAFGFAWSPFKNNATVIRGGGGIYWDSTPGYYKLREAPVIGPPGNGRSTLSASQFTNIYPGILDLNTGKPVTIGSALPLSPQFTNLTVGQFVNIVNTELPAIAAVLAPGNPPTSGPYSVSGIDISKSGVELYPPNHFPLARSYQTSLGIQQALGHDFVLTADWARRQGENVSLGEVDDNHFNLYNSSFQQSPVIPICAASQVGIPGQECSTGPITAWTDQGRSVYEGLLLKVQKRLSHNYQVTFSYAYQGLKSDTNYYDYVNFMSGYGNILNRQNLNISGIVNLKWGFQLSLNSAIISRMPVEANIGANPLPGVDLNTNNQGLPGLPSFSCLNEGCGKGALASAVASYNATYAGTKDASGGAFPTLVLPPNYALSSPLLSQDFRLTKTFTVRERYNFILMAEMFNTFNVSNLTIGSYQLDPLAGGCTLANSVTTMCPSQTYSFGQPTNRVAQTFGQGGPRALQLAARFTF
jgi:hypothetical protein